MNTAPPHDIDARARQLHAGALETLSPTTLARLRQARQAASSASSASRRRTPGWLLATACSTVLAVGVGVHLLRPPASAPTLPADSIATTAGDADELFDQNPDLYVWLGSDTALAME